MSAGRKEQRGLEGPESGPALPGVPQQHLDVARLCHGGEKGQQESARSAGATPARRLTVRSIKSRAVAVELLVTSFVFFFLI